jgi:hypothetical protein
MRTAERLNTHAAWVAAQEQRRVCARPECDNERSWDGLGGGSMTTELCFGCALEAELFDRDARWTAARR